MASRKKKKYDSEKIRKIVKQLSGELDPDDDELEPAYKIKGTGHLWCFSPISNSMVRILRGSKVYLLQENIKNEDEVMIFVAYEVVNIDKNEIIKLGYN
tara:strand:+ start:22843 stop:23139 length:297 start_codon:yes stop_codon:yes gene_type:complete